MLVACEKVYKVRSKSITYTFRCTGLGLMLQDVYWLFTRHRNDEGYHKVSIFLSTAHFKQDGTNMLEFLNNLKRR